MILYHYDSIIKHTLTTDIINSIIHFYVQGKREFRACPGKIIHIGVGSILALIQTQQEHLIVSQEQNQTQIKKCNTVYYTLSVLLLIDTGLNGFHCRRAPLGSGFSFRPTSILVSVCTSFLSRFPLGTPVDLPASVSGQLSEEEASQLKCF